MKVVFDYLPEFERRATTQSKDIFASFSGDWGGDMSTEDYADMLRSENVESSRTVDTW